MRLSEKQFKNTSSYRKVKYIGTLKTVTDDVIHQFTLPKNISLQELSFTPANLEYDSFILELIDKGKDKYNGKLIPIKDLGDNVKAFIDEFPIDIPISVGNRLIKMTV